ncbi:MAG TPA: hypothetical protein VNL71_14615, partial [Chloroflexota bacterium]|nr:hypothetical protein [Chloroflexota bacterium]
MTSMVRVSAVVVFGLALVFYAFFQIPKTTPAFQTVSPYFVDPYDAVGSFAFQAAVVLGALSVARAFWPGLVTTPARMAFSARAQIMTILAVGITVVTDAVAMARHVDQWVGSPAGQVLAGLLSAMIVLTAVVGVLAYRTVRRFGSAIDCGSWVVAAALSMSALIVLAVYPPEAAGKVGDALITIGVGILCLFVPL